MLHLVLHVYFFDSFCRRFALDYLADDYFGPEGSDRDPKTGLFVGFENRVGTTEGRFQR